MFSLSTPYERRQLISVVTATAVTGFALYGLWSSSRKNQTGLSAIPTPKGNVFYFGHLFCFKKLPGLQFADWAKELGPIIRVQMGVQPWVVLSDAQLTQELLVTKGAVASDRPFHTFSTRYYALGGKGIVMAKHDKKWRNTRSAALSILSPHMVSHFSDVHQREADQLVESLIDLTARHGSVNPRRILQRSFVNFILETCFAQHIDSLDDPLFESIVEFVEEAVYLGGLTEDFSSFLPILSFLDVIFRRERRFEHFIKTKRDPLFHRLVRDALESDKDNLFKRLYHMKEEYGLDNDDILVTAGDLVTGGTDTTAVTTGWILAVLLHYPEVQKKIQREIDDFVHEHKRLPDFSERDAFPFLNSVQRECIRYKPIQYFSFFHVTKEDINFHGYLIRKGTCILPNTYAMHRDPNIYPEPEKFMPERFMHNKRTMAAAANGKLQERDHFVFGWGRRVCPGIHLAEVQMFNVLVRIFAKCNLEPPRDKQGNPILPDLESPVDHGVVLLPPPYEARFVPRSLLVHETSCRAVSY